MADNRYNSQSFTPEEVKKGLHLILLKALLELNTQLENSYNDIHIWTDGYCTIIEWCEVHSDGAFGDGQFEYVGENQAVLTRFEFPDHHEEYLYNKAEYEDRLKEWREENPDFVE